MAIVVDASVLAECLVDSPLGRRAWTTMSQEPGGLHLPHLAGIEATSVLRRWVRAGVVPEPRAREALADLGLLRARRWPVEPLLDRIWELRDNLSAYDAAYVALAESLDATLLTSDARLARGSEGRGRCRIVVVST